MSSPSNSPSNFKTNNVNTSGSGGGGGAGRHKLSSTPPPRPLRSKYRPPYTPPTPSFQQSKSTSSISTITEQDLLTFYGLTTLEPTVWFDTADVSLATPQKTSQSSLAATSQTSLTTPISSMATTTPTTVLMTPPALTSSSTAMYVPKEGLDPLGRYPSIFQALTPAQLQSHRTHVSVFSKHFQPRLYLSLVHPTLTYTQFEEGLRKLGSQGEHHHALLRTLVRDNFHAHVVAKATIDTVFQAMVQHALTPTFGDAFLETLDIGASTAAQVFGPMLVKRARMESMKAMVLVLQRFQFFFSLPGALRVAVQQGHLDTAVRDFKKGKEVMAIMGGLDGQQGPGAGDGTGAAGGMGGYPKKLVERTWASVSHLIHLVKEHLVKQLHEHECPLEVHEQAVRLILEIDPAADPLWIFLESRYKWILAQLKEKVTMQFKACTFNGTNEQQSQVKFTPNQFRKAILLRNKKEFETIFAKDPEVQAWQTLTQVVRVLTEAFVAFVPDFSKLVQTYAAKPGVDAARVDGCAQMTLALVKYWVAWLRHVCQVPVLETFHVVFPKVTNVNALTVAHFAPKFAPVLVHAKDQLASMVGASPAASRAVADAFGEIQGAWMELLVEAWKRDASRFSSLEESPSTDPPSGSSLLSLYSTYTKCMLQSGYKLWHLQGHQSSTTYSAFIYPTYFEAHQLFFKRLVHDAMATPPIQKKPIMTQDRLTLILVSQLNQAMQLATAWDTYLTNLSSTPTVGETGERVTSSLEGYLQSLKKDVVRSFIRHQVDMLEPLLQKNMGVQHPVQFGTAPPSALRPWVYQLMHHFNGLHVMLSTCLPEQEHQVLSEVILAVAQSQLTLLRAMEQMHEHVASQLRLELMFLQQSLPITITTSFTSTTVQEVFDAMYNVVKVRLSTHLEAVLQNALDATRLQFYGFKCEVSNENK